MRIVLLYLAISYHKHNIRILLTTADRNSTLLITHLKILGLSIIKSGMLDTGQLFHFENITYDRQLHFA